MAGLPLDVVGPPLVLLVTVAATLLADAVTSGGRAVAVATAGLALAGAGFVWSTFTGATAVAFGAFQVRGGTAAVAGLACLIAAAALTAGHVRLAARSNGGQVGALLAFSTLGCVALIQAVDMGALVVSLELVAVCGYALVSAASTPRAEEVAMKYLVQGAVATGMLAYGLAIVVGAHGGALGYATLGRSLAAVAGTRSLAAGMVLLLAALAFKAGGFPFHSWAPDVYETADPAVASFLAAVPKIAALVATVTLLSRVFAAEAGTWTVLVIVISVASVAFGSLGGLRQVSYRRMLGYSGIAHVGYAFAGLVAVPTFGPGPLIVFVGTYALAAAGAFLAAEAATEGTGWDGATAGLAGMGRDRPWLAAALAVCLLSLTGIPLTAGFWGKFLVFGTVSFAGYVWLAIVGVIGSVVSFGYYGHVLRAVYFEDPPDPASAEEGETRSGRLAEAVVVAIAALVLAGGILPLVFGSLAFDLFAR